MTGQSSILATYFALARELCGEGAEPKRKSSSNAGKYDCPNCIHNFPDRWPDKHDLALWCRHCMAGSNFSQRPISELEMLPRGILARNA